MPFYLLIVGLLGGFAPKIEKSTDRGTGSFLLVFPPAASLISSRCSSILWTLYAFPSKPSRSRITRLDFLEGDKTVGPSCELKSEALDSCLGAGLGSLSGTVGRGADEKYLNKKYGWDQGTKSKPHISQLNG